MKIIIENDFFCHFYGALLFQRQNNTNAMKGNHKSKVRIIHEFPRCLLIFPRISFTVRLEKSIGYCQSIRQYCDANVSSWAGKSFRLMRFVGTIYKFAKHFH